MVPRYRQGDYERTRALADATLELNRDLGDERETARSLGELGNIAVALGEYEEALSKYAESSELFRKLDEPGRMAQVLANMGAVANMRGDYDEGRRLGGEALALQRESGNVEAATVSLHNLARIDLGTGRLAAAADLSKGRPEPWRRSSARNASRLSVRPGVRRGCRHGGRCTAVHGCCTPRTA